MNSLRSIRILPVFLVLLLAAALPQGVAPTYAQGTAQAIVSGIPPILQSPFVVDFEQDYQQRRFQMQFIYTGQQPASFRFVASLTKEGQQLFSVTSEPTFFEPGTYLYTHLSDNPSISFSEGFDDLVDQLSGRIKRQVIESGAFPEGFYTLRMEPVAADASTFVTGVPGTATFTVMYPEPPRLLSVADQSNLNTLHPSFAWTPVIAPPGTTVDYDVLITEVLANQTPLQALLGNRAHAQVDITGQTTFAYIANQLPLEAGKTYVWQVAATAELAGRVLPLKDDGRSEIWTFAVGAAPGLVAEAPSYVSDGTGEDLDYVNSVTSLSANWGPVTGASSYSYAIGSSSGGTDVLNWTDAGQQTQATRSGLSLTHKVKYFVSVRANSTGGESGQIVTSDGVVADTSRPTSSVEIAALKNKVGRPFLNDANFQVTWSGWDNASPVTHYEIQYKHGADLVWTTWMAKTDQQSATFPSALRGGDGKYRFRSRAWDAAGNEKTLKDIVEAEVTIDTATPSSEIAKLEPQQASGSFLVSWAGTDATSGVESYDIEYQEDGGTWKSWLSAVPAASTSNQFQGTAGIAYGFRIAARDSAGNVEAFPQVADASTTTLGSTIALTASAAPALSNFYYDWNEDDQTLSHSCSHSVSSNLDSCPVVTMLFAAPSGVSMKVDQVSLTWSDDSGQQVAVESFSNLFVGSISPVLKGGQSGTIDLLLAPVGSFFDKVMKDADAAFDKTLKWTPITHNVTAVLRGNYMGSDQVPHSLSSNPVAIKVVYRPIAPPMYTVTVSATPSSISYTPTKLSSNVDVKLSLVGIQGDELTLDKVVNRWYDSTKNLFQELSNSLSTPLVLKDTPPAGPAAFMDVTRKLDLTLSASSITKALGGQSSATYTVHVEYQGKDQHGSPVAFSTENPITVQFFADAPTLLVSFSPSSIVFSPAKLQHSVDISYSLTSPVSTSVQVESVTNYFYKEDDTLFDKGTAVVTPFTVQSGQTVTRTMAYSWSASSLQKALAGKSSSLHTVKLEANAKDEDQNTVTGTTVEPLTIYSQKSDVSVDVAFSPPTVTFTPDQLSNQLSVTYTLTSQSGKSVTLDKVTNKWYSEDGSLYWSDSEALSSPRQLTTAASLSVHDTFSFPLSQFNQALGGKNQATYTAEIIYSGTDSDGIPIKAVTTKPLTAVFSASTAKLLATVTPDKYVFDTANLERKWTAKLDYKSDVALDVNSAQVTWYDIGGKQVSKDKVDLLQTYSFSAPSSSNTFSLDHTITDYERTLALNRPGSVWMTTPSGGKYKEEIFKLKFEFSGTDAVGRSITATSNEVEATLRETAYPLEVTASPASISTSDSPVDLDITINSDVSSAVTLVSRTYLLKKGTTLVPVVGMEPFGGMGKPETAQPTVQYGTGGGATEIIAAKGLWKDKISIPLNVSYLLGTSDKVQVSAEIIYKGTDAAGKAVEGRVFVPIEVKKPGQIDDTEGLVASAGYYELIPKVAFVQALKDLTTVTTSGANRVLSGAVRLVLIPAPFDSTKLAVDATNLTFAPVAGKTEQWTIKGGSLSEEGTQLKPDLFRFYKDIVRVSKISYNHARTKRMQIDKAEARIPVLEKSIFLTNLLIDKDGLHIESGEAEVSGFGWTFRVTEIKQQSGSTGSLLALTAGIRMAGKPVSAEFTQTTLTIKESQGKKSVSMNVKPTNPFRFIPNTDYLNLTSMYFDEKTGDDWVLKVGVESKDLPLMSKLGPLTGTLTYDRSGKLAGLLELIPRETVPGTPPTDKSFVEIGKLAKIDLTYVGLQLAGKEVITIQNAKPDTSWEFDTSQSYIGMAADLYLPMVGDPNNRIAIGSVSSTSVSPGIQVNFDGNVTTKTISVAAGKKLDLGPLYLKLTALTLKPYPFEMGISGGIGVDAAGIVDGEIDVAGLKVDQDGDFTNFSDVVSGGQLSILKAVTIGLKDVAYKNTPSTLQFQDKVGNAKKDVSLTVDSYFQLTGATLTLTGCGGGFDNLLVYEKDGNTSFVLKGAKVNVKNQIDLNVDFSYINDSASNTQALSAGGNAKIAKKYSAGVYGALGTRSGESYWGFYVGVAGLQIPVGPGINLEEVGGGFFWNPTLNDIDKVKNAAGFKDPKLAAHIVAMKPTATAPLTFAAFLNGGVSIGANELFKGRGLLTVTGNSAKLNVEAEVMAATVKGNGYLEVSWNPWYVEGNFKVILDIPLIDCEDQLTFYAYSEQAWGITGKVQVGVLSFVTTTAEFYAGNDGFMFDLTVKKGIDIFIISGGIEFEVMAWWRKDVSWGAYAAGKAYGDLLAGLIGGEVGIEGAFIGSPEVVIFMAGHLKIELLWQDVFDGRVWISMGENGFDSGTGKSSRYDDIIADAKNTGKKMKSDMEKLAEDLKNAQNSLLSLSNKQLSDAGNALVELIEIKGFDQLIKNEYQKDLNAVASSAKATFNNAYAVIFSPQSPKLGSLDVSLSSTETQIDATLNSLKSKEADVRSLLLSFEDVLTGDLPTVQNLGTYSNPVGQLSYQTVTLTDTNGVTMTKTVKAGYGFDTKTAQDLDSGVKKELKSALAYRQKLMQMTQQLGTKLNSVDQLLSGSGKSVNTLVNDYGQTSQMIGNHTTQRLDYFDERVKLYSKQWLDLSTLQSQIQAGIAKDLSDAGTNAKLRAQTRNNLVNKLLTLSNQATRKFPDQHENWAALADTLGRYIWYDIPLAGFDAVTKGSGAAREKFVADFQNTNNTFQANWSLATLTADKVYSRKARLYTLLYDLLDQLSMEAGTRKETPAWDGALLVGVIALDGLSGGTQTGGGTQAAAVGPAGGQQPAAAPGTFVATSDWTKGWDFEKERLNVKKMLQVPQITGFSGQVVSDKTPAYAKLSLTWNATHPMSIAEYSLDIPDYSKPVKMAPQAPTQQIDPNQIDPQGGVAVQLPGDAQKIGAAGGQAPGMILVQDVVGMQGTTQMQTPTQSPSLDPTQAPGAAPTQPGVLPIAGGGPVSFGPSTVHAWRSLAGRTSTTIPFLLGVHEPGTYEVWLRARGAGGLALQRLATINVQYAFSGSPDGADFGAQTKKDALSSADTTPPTTPLVHDGGATTKNRNLLYVTWTATDYESGIQEYQYRVVTKAAGQSTPVTSWFSTGGQTEINIKFEEPMKPAVIYYVQVKAKNGAGAWSGDGISDGIQLSDPTPPTAPAIRTPRLVSDTLTVAWSSARDPESQVVGYRYAIGSRPQDTNMLDWTYTQDTGFVIDINTLSESAGKTKDATTIYVSVCAVNGIGVDSPIAMAQTAPQQQTKQ